MNGRGKEEFDLYNAQGSSMIVEGTCVIHMVSEECPKTRTLKCLITPNLEEEEVLLGWMDMVKGGYPEEGLSHCSRWS